MHTASNDHLGLAFAVVHEEELTGRDCDRHRESELGVAVDNPVALLIFDEELSGR